jgi:tRNA dimethylallyltransferase
MSQPIIKNSSLAGESKVLFIVGPTASGKSSLAMRVAREFDGEIICADSQTLRKDLDIGTAKPSIHDQAEIRHHMLDIIGPYDSFSVTNFQARAVKAIADIKNRNKLPIIVGGTGLYIDSLFYQYDLAENIENDTYKVQLQTKSVEDLQELIYQEGFELPVNSQNQRHLIGVLLRQNRSSENTTPMSGASIFGLLPDDDVLKERISHRVSRMFDNGFIEEVKQVIAAYGQPPEKLDAIGYPIVGQYLEQKIDLAAAKELFTRAHWQYARRQKSWFNRNKYIVWSGSSDEAYLKVEQLLK